MVGLLEIRRRRVQFLLIALVVTLISYLVLMINGLGVGLNVLAGSALQSFNADAIAYADAAGLSVVRSEMSDETIETLRTTGGVRAVAPIGYVAANYRQSNGEVKSAAFIGYDPGTIAEPEVVAGRRLTNADSLGLLADTRFLDASGLRVGDTVEIAFRLQKLRFEIVGEIDEGAFFFQPVVYVLRSTWQTMKYGADSSFKPTASIVLLKGSGLAGTKGPGYEAVSKSAAFANIEGVSAQQSTVKSLQAFGYLIGAMVIGVFFYVLTLQKVPQIGMLKALGASGFFIFRQLLVQALAVSAVGLAIALPLAWLTDQGLQRLSGSIPIAFTTSTWVITAAGLVVMALVGTLISGRQVSKVDPIIALGQQQ